MFTRENLKFLPKEELIKIIFEFQRTFISLEDELFQIKEKERSE